MNTKDLGNIPSSFPGGFVVLKQKLQTFSRQGSHVIYIKPEALTPLILHGALGK